MRGFTARILSNRFSPLAMQREVEIFIRDMEGEIMSQLTQTEVNERVNALISNLSDPPTSYREEADDFWGSILDERGFDWTQRVISALKGLDVATIQQSFAKWFLNADGNQRSISVMIFGKGKTASLNESTVNAECPVECHVSQLPEGMQSLFPSMTELESDGSTTSQSATGVQSGFLVDSLESLKDVRTRLDLFEPADIDEDEGACDEDGESRV